ncbi:MAG: oligopeptide transporter, OPT family [Clostridia bacterium]|nr:oligopeptide transporter, OPT family [Clostridia bacterium]
MNKKQELTYTSVITGILLAIAFGGANAYLGLRVGMTVSASIPAAVLSMGIIRIVLKRNSILENNMVQTIGSAGESIAAGAIFTLPALFMWSAQWGTAPPSLLEICLISFCGGILGISFMIPLRSVLISNPNENLPYPEGTACAEVLMAGEEKGASASSVFKGLTFAGIYKIITDGLGLFPSQLHYEPKSFKGSGIGIDILPALTGVGYICGPKISSYMLGGGILSWLVLMPLLCFTGNTELNNMTSHEIWSSYIRYIGAGAVAAGGIISLVKSLPLIITTFSKAFKGLNKDNKEENKDIPFKIILFLILLLILIIWLVPFIPVTFTGAVIIALFGFFFATVSSRLVGLVGSSNNPVSGMTIATLLISAFILKASGYDPRSGMVGAIAIGSVICIVTAIAGDTSQDLKTGHILGATPWKQQIGEYIGVSVSSLFIGAILFLLNKAWGYGSSELPAPQATLMKLVVEGVMGGSLPWGLVLTGAFIAVFIEIIGVPVLPFCIGLYLPIHLSMGIMSGGLIRLWSDSKKIDSKSGVLYSSGMIAGEGLVGILLAVFAIIPAGTSTLGDFINISEKISFGSIGGGIAFILLCISLIYNINSHSKK